MEPSCLSPLAELSEPTTSDPTNSQGQITSLGVQGNPQNSQTVNSGDYLQVTSGKDVQIFQASAQVTEGSQPIPIVPAKANFAFPANSTLADLGQLGSGTPPANSSPPGIGTTPDATLDSSHGFNQCASATLAQADLNDIANNLQNDAANWCDFNTQTCSKDNYCTIDGQLLSIYNDSCNWAPYYVNLAYELAGDGDGDAYLRIGPEAEGNWYAWQYGPDVSDWAKYFGKIVKTMNNAEAQYNASNGTNYQFKFVWNMGLCAFTSPTIGGTPMPASEAWPTTGGSPNLVGLDFSDQDVCSAFQSNDPTYTDPYDAWNDEWTEAPVKGNAATDGYAGFEYWLNFAQSKGVGLALTQWEPSQAYGSNDNAYFISQISKNLIAPSDHVVYSTYFDTTGNNGTFDNRLSTPNALLNSTLSAGPATSPEYIDVGPMGFSIAAGDSIVVSYGNPEASESESQTFTAAAPASASTSPQQMQVDPEVVDYTFPVGSSGSNEPVVVDTNVPSPTLPNSAACYQYFFFQNSAGEPTCETALNSTTLSAGNGLTGGSLIKNLKVVATTFGVNGNDCIQVTHGKEAQTFVADKAESEGSTKIAIVPAVVTGTQGQQTFPPGSIVTDTTNVPGGTSCTPPA